MKRRSSSLDSAFYAHYRTGVERNRLLHGTSSLEYYRTKQIVSRYLPRRRATILDIGWRARTILVLARRKGPPCSPSRCNDSACQTGTRCSEKSKAALGQH